MALLAAKKLSRVAAGHAKSGGAPVRVEEDENGKPATILKVLDENELEVYKLLSSQYADDSIHEFIATFHGVFEDSNDGSKFIRIANVLCNFYEPKVVDVKIGNRTFGESECKNTKPRPDLYDRMVERYPTALTAEEHQAKAVTKHKWMTTNDANTTIGTLGYRVDGIAGCILDGELRDLRTRDDVTVVFRCLVDFICAGETPNPEGSFPTSTPTTVTVNVLHELKCIQKALVKSEFFKRHEFIGSSLLLVADAYGQVKICWIDFAKVQPIAEGTKITHHSAWELGNHEDGFLSGLNNLISTWEQVLQTLNENEEDYIGASMPLPKTSSIMMKQSITSAQWTSSRPTQSMFSCSMSMDTARMQHNPSFNCRSDISVLSSLPLFSGVVATERGDQAYMWADGLDTSTMSSLRQFTAQDGSRASWIPSILRRLWNFITRRSKKPEHSVQVFEQGSW